MILFCQRDLCRNRMPKQHHSTFCMRLQSNFPTFVQATRTFSSFCIRILTISHRLRMIKGNSLCMPDLPNGVMTVRESKYFMLLLMMLA